MKCPKCGYLGFETTDRCRNCQYDFSLSPFSSDPDLTLRQDHGVESAADFEVPAITSQAASLTPGLDLDRLFGDAEAGTSAAEPAVRPSLEVAPPAAPAESLPEPAHELVPDSNPSEELQPATLVESVESADAKALPFDETPLPPPRAARPPLAVRRATPEIPRNRPRTTRPVRVEAPLAFEPPPVLKGGEVGTLAGETVASLMRVPALAVRVGAALIDLALLAALDAAVLFLTLRVAGLQSTVEDLRVIPVVPFVGFLGLLAFGYVAAFTVAGGQTIGKMILKLRVIGDDGRSIDAAGGMLRAVGCMLVPVTLGLSFVPALFSSDHRALHDRLAGTRVVSE